MAKRCCCCCTTLGAAAVGITFTSASQVGGCNGPWRGTVCLAAAAAAAAGSFGVCKLLGATAEYVEEGAPCGWLLQLWLLLLLHGLQPHVEAVCQTVAQSSRHARLCRLAADWPQQVQHPPVVAASHLRSNTENMRATVMQACKVG